MAAIIETIEQRHQSNVFTIITVNNNLNKHSTIQYFCQTALIDYIASESSNIIVLA